MEFNKIISVAGKPGLYEIVTQTKNSLIVQSLIDKKRVSISAAQNVSLLENIAIYTYEKEVPLITVFKSMFEKEEGKEAINHKENSKKLVEYFEEILPDYDVERVYTSNIKKIIQWYNALIAIDFDFSKVAISEETPEKTE